MQFFPNDWRSEPSLSLLSLSARGLWFEFLLVMHMDDRSGVISGTREELAQLGRCSAVEVSSAIDEFKLRKTCDVTERNSVVTLVNRRMRREWEARKHGAERVRKHRETRCVTHQNRIGNGDIPYSRDHIPEAREGTRARVDEPLIPTIEEIAAHCSMGIGIPRDYCQHYHDKKTIANGWIKNGQLVQWRIEIVKWWTKDRATWKQAPKPAQELPDFTGARKAK